MLRNSLLALIAVFMLIATTACGKKEEPAPAKSETATTAEPAKPAYKPGEMVLIPAGEFTLGTGDDKETTWYPKQKISLPAFWIDKYEVTNSDFLDFCIKTGYQVEGTKENKTWRSFFTADKALNPVVFITWKDASEYCKSAGKRLPTEEEWEKAARGPEGYRYPWGDKWENNRSNTFETGLRNPGKVGDYADDVSAYGVHDMLGNVQEWTDTWYKAYKGNNKKDPNYGQRFRVVRGASARIYGSKFHLAIRSGYFPNAAYDFGCRCAKDATPEEAAKAAPPAK